MDGIINVLLAMPQQKDEGFLDDIRQDFEAAGLKVGRLDVRAKSLVHQYLEMFKDTNVLIITQHQANESYTAQELDELSMVLEAEPSCLIPILDEKKGSEYLRQLDAMAIYTAVFEDDADYMMIANLILNGRSKKEARIYYGIVGRPGGIELHSAEEFDVSSAVRYLVSADGDYLELESRLAVLAAKLKSTSLLLEVLGKLPDNTFLLVSRMENYRELCRLLLEKKLELPGPPKTAAGKEQVPGKFARIKKEADNKEKEITTAINIGFVSTNVGVGCTYSAVLLAHVLAKQGTVAIVEYDDSDEHFEHLCRCVNGTWNVSGITEFKIGKVSYFYHIPYSRCCVQIRPCYDYVIYDFGCGNDEVIDKFFLSMDYQFVITGGGDWRIGELAEFIHDVSFKDERRQFIYLVPLICKRELENYREIADGNILAAIPFEENPYQPSRKAERLFKRLMARKYTLHKKRLIPIKEKAERRGLPIRKAAVLLSCLCCLVLGYTSGFGRNSYYRKAMRDLDREVQLQKQEIVAASNNQEKLKKQLEGLVVTVFIPKSTVAPGTLVTDDMVEPAQIYSSISGAHYLSQDELGNVSAEVELEVGVPILRGMVRVQ